MPLARMLPVPIVLGLMVASAFAQPDDAGAYRACQNMIADHALKNPGSAKWPPIEAVEQLVVAGKYIFKGHLDAQNDFGALKRLTFECKIADRGTKWRALRLIVNGQTLFDQE